MDDIQLFLSLEARVLLVFIWSLRLRRRDLFDFPVTYFLHSTVCPVDGDLCSSVLGGVLGRVSPGRMGLRGDLLSIKRIVVLITRNMFIF